MRGLAVTTGCACQGAAGLFPRTWLVWGAAALLLALGAVGDPDSVQAGEESPAIFPADSPGQTGGGSAPAGEEMVLSLEECLALALERSPTLAAARERLAAASGNVGVARANLLPQIGMSSQMNRYSRERLYYNYRSESAGGLFPTASRVSYAAGIGVQQSLFSGGRNVARLHAAGERRRGAEEGLRDTRLATRLAVTEAYLELLRAQHLLQVAEETMDASRQRQERVEALFTVGSVARADVLQNKVQLAEDELALIQVRNQVGLAGMALVNAMGAEADRPVRVRELPVADQPVPDLAPLLRQAENRSAQLADLTAQTRAARADVTVARSGNYPSLDLSWDYGWSNYRLPRSRGEWNDNADWAAGLVFRLSIFDGLATRSSVSAARHTLRQSEHQLEQARRDLALEVKREHSSLMEARERTRVAGESVAAATEQVRLQEERYRLGAATLLELIDAQVGLTRAKTSEVEAQYDYSLARARLQRAVGSE